MLGTRGSDNPTIDVATLTQLLRDPDALTAKIKEHQDAREAAAAAQTAAQTKLNEATTAQAALDARYKDVGEREAKLAADLTAFDSKRYEQAVQIQADRAKLRSDRLSLTTREENMSADFAAREAKFVETGKILDKRAAVLLGRESSVGNREKAVEVREKAATALKNDLEARLSQLRGLLA